MNPPDRGLCRVREGDLRVRARYYLRRQRMDMQAQDRVNGMVQPGGNVADDVIEQNEDNGDGEDILVNPVLELPEPDNEPQNQENDNAALPLDDDNEAAQDPPDDYDDPENEDVDDNESDDEGDEYLNLNWQERLYEGAPVTVGQTLTIVLGLMLRHNLSLTCVDDILTSYRLISPNAQYQQTSAYHLKKYFSLGNERVLTKHYYCSVCLASIPDPNNQCHICNENTTFQYFVEAPFLKQLGQVVKRNGFMDLLQHRFNRGDMRPNVIKDIYDGEVYQNQVHNGFLSDPNNISFLWYADGVPVFKSSKISMWPIYLSINELPYQKRTSQENILLAAVWFGKKKAEANLILSKLRHQFEELHQGKVFRLHNGNQIRMRGVLLAGTCDVPAKTNFLNLTLFSGAYGCCNCKLQGYTHYHDTGGHSQIFPYERNIRIRTSEETNEQGTRVVINNIEEGIVGVKGLSALYQLMPDYIGGMGIDVMHKVYGGCVKKLLYVWFHSSYSHEPFSLRHVMANIDRRLTSIRPPKHVHRMPRTVEELCHWKCSELKNWFYFFSVPVLSDILLPVYFNHYLLLVVSVALLNSENITHLEVQKARTLIHKFVRRMPELYGARQSTINVHGLLHLPECVFRLGPLFVYNCLPYEDLNGKILRHVHGTSNLDSQIVVRHIQTINLSGRLQDLADGEVRDFVLDWKKKQVKINELVFQDCYSVGKYAVLHEVPDQIRICLQNLNVQLGTISIYFRLLKNKKLFVCENYPKIMKTLSSCVLFERNGMRLVGSITQFVKVTNCECQNNICRCQGNHFAIVNELITATCFYAMDDNNRHYPVSHLKSFQRSNVYYAVPLNDLGAVCFWVSVDDQNYVGFPINSLEKE